jgi:hypothetical protein
MAATIKSTPKRKPKPVPPPGRKMSALEARDYVFKKHGGALALLAKH